QSLREDVSRVAAPQLRLERPAQAVARLEHAARGGHRNGYAGWNLQVHADGIDHVRELSRSARQEAERLRITGRGSRDHQPGKLRELTALRDVPPVDGGAEI